MPFIYTSYEDQCSRAPSAICALTPSYHHPFLPEQHEYGHFEIIVAPLRPSANGESERFSQDQTDFVLIVGRYKLASSLDFGISISEVVFKWNIRERIKIAFSQVVNHETATQCFAISLHSIVSSQPLTSCFMILRPMHRKMKTLNEQVSAFSLYPSARLLLTERSVG